MSDSPDTDPAQPRLSGAAASRDFGRYLLLGTIARGGMGEIHLALAGSIAHAQKLCVVKTIRAEATHADDLVARFLDEGRVLCALQHPNIGQVMEVGVEQGVPFLAMEYVGGTDLAEIIDACRGSRRYPSIALVLSCLAGVLDGMAYAHRACGLDGVPFHLVHRDLSPENMRASWDGDVKVLDFGTALAVGRTAHTIHGAIFGKPGYMAPEQARREPLDPRTDLYAIGVVAWELLTQLDWMTLELVPHLDALARGTHRPAAASTLRSDVSPLLDDWIARLTAFDPAHRFPDATTARRALLDIAQTLRVRIDREVIAEGLAELLPGAQATESERNRRWIAEARAHRGSTADPPRLRQQVSTQPQGPRDAQMLPGTPYRLGAQIGAGAMGEVFAAEHTDLGRPVALKVLSPTLSSDPMLVQRFRLEARAIAALSHPNLVQVYDLGTTLDGRLFFAMERLRGESLRGRLERAKSADRGRLPPAECVRIGVAIARALAAAHAVGVVHRDIKPENVFLTEDGGVKVLDFGVAKTNNSAILGGTDGNVTRAGELFGSPAYMAPEQARGRDVDARTDLYAVGAVLYECATGTQLFEDATMIELLARHMGQEPDPPRGRAPDANIPVALEAVILRCLAKEPSHRFDSAVILADVLGRALDPGAVIEEAPPVTVTLPVHAFATVTDAPAAAAPPSRGWVKAVAGLAAVALVTVVVLGIFHKPTRRPARPAPRPAVVAASPPPAPPTPPAPVVVAAPPPAVVDAGAAVVVAVVDAGAPPPSVARHAPSAYALAQQSFAAGRYPETIARANEAVAQGGARALDARVLIGKARNAMGQRAEAVRALRMVLDRDPTHRGARSALAAMGETL